MTQSCSQLLTKLTVLGSFIVFFSWQPRKSIYNISLYFKPKTLRENALNKIAYNFPVPLSLSETLIRVPHYFNGIGLRVMKKQSGFCKSLLFHCIM